MRQAVGCSLSFLCTLVGVPLCSADSPRMPMVRTGEVYFIGDDIPIAVSTPADTLDYRLEWVLVDRSSVIGETYHGTGTVREVKRLGRVAFLPTSMLTRKGVYYLSAKGIPRHRILLVDPVPTIEDPLTWPFGQITSPDQIQRGAEMAEEFLRVGVRWVKTSLSFERINSIGENEDPNAGRISPGYEDFIDEAHQLGLRFYWQLGNHYSEIADPTDLHGAFYSGLRKIQEYYRGKVHCWSLGNEVEGGGYSKFTVKQYADVLRNMSLALKGVDPDVRIVAGEFYNAWNPYLDELIRPPYRDHWDILAIHKVVGLHGTPCSGVSDYIENLEGLKKSIWDTEVASGCIHGGPSADAFPGQMRSWFPHEGFDDEHGGLDKSVVRTFCLETKHEEDWLPAFYKPEGPVLGAEMFFGYHYNGTGHTLWALRRRWIDNYTQEDAQNHKVAGFRTVCDMLYGAQGITRIPNTDVPDPCRASPKDKYVRADGYIFKHGPEYIVILWQNTGQANMDREMVLTTNDRNSVLNDSLGNRYPLRNERGQVKVWVPIDLVYVRGFTEIPRFSLDETEDDLPYFVTSPITKAVVGQGYYYNARAYDSDVPASGSNSLPRITYRLVGAPPGMTLSVNSRAGDYCNRTSLLHWIPRQVGSFRVTIRATSDHGVRQTVDQTFTIDVVSASTNVTPQILSHPATTAARVGYVWWYNVYAHDPNGDEVTYSLSQSPPGMTIDPKTGFLQWTPARDGIFPATVRAADEKGGLATQSFTLRVGP